MMDTTLYISLGTFLTILGMLKPMFDANKMLENRLTRMESDLKHLESQQLDRDKDTDKISKKLESLETKISKIELSITRIETLLQGKIPSSNI